MHFSPEPIFFHLTSPIFKLTQVKSRSLCPFFSFPLNKGERLAKGEVRKILQW